MSYPLQPLSALGTIQTGSTPLTSDEKYWNGSYPFVTPAELDQNFPITNTPRTLSDEGANQSRLLHEGAVMVCCIGSLGKIGIAGRSVVTNQQINSIEFDQQKIWPKFGYYACKRLKPRLVSMAPATTIPIVSKSKFGQLEIPVPPLPEQRRIAAILDQADALRAKRREALAQLDSLTQSIFIEMFGDPAKNPKGWPITLLESVAIKITDGEHQTPKRTDSGIKLLSARNVRDGYLDFGDVDFIDIEEHKRISKRCNPERGDILISCSGSIGRVAIVATDEPLGLVRSAALVKPNTQLVQSKYLESFLRTPHMNRMMIRKAHSSSQANLFQGPIRALPITLPPLSLQQVFAEKSLALQNIRNLHISASSELDTLFASLQHRAFRGEL